MNLISFWWSVLSFLNLFVISTISIELNLINFIFLYLTTCESELMSTKSSFITMSAQETSINFQFLLKTILFIKFTAFGSFSLRIFFIASRIIFFCFWFFKTRANYFNKNFYETLWVEKLFSCRAARIFINIFSSWNFSLLCLFSEKDSFFTMITELTFIAQIAIHWLAASTDEQL